MATKKETTEASKQEAAASTFDVESATPSAPAPVSAPDSAPALDFSDYVIPADFADERAFVVAGKTFWNNYTRKDTNEKVDFLSTILPDPFNDEDFRDVSIRPKWENSGGIFNYKAKKALRGCEYIPFPVVVKPVTFYSSRAKKTLTVAGIFIANPFGKGFVEFSVKNKGDAAVFAMLAAERWSMSLDVPATDDDENVAE